MKGLNIWQVLILTFLYVLLKLLLVFALFEAVVTLVEDPFLQVEFGEFLSALIALSLLILLFKKTFKNTEKERLALSKMYYVLLIFILAIGIHLLKDPFFRYKHILFEEPLLNPSNLGSIDFSLDIVFKMIYTIILLPVLEELLFRRIIFKSLLNKYSNLWIAILISSLLFSIIHLSINNLIPTFLFGVIASYIYFKTNNIWYSILLHVISNLIWFIIYLYPKKYWEVLEILNFGVSYWLIITFGIGLIFLITNQYRKLKLN
ncbi:CPBP family intramembrane glutamic endopeptidase [Aquimarina macrocephali]|uniref:CPBP family intramembrane glutamic endopeptidase n=1 Tax=Aquimarina macrocephali TaxID=666563 RepID=UPI0013779BB7|nr:CPBP family intramembrane glutamic endopeptidase [Aquimarina macrocephali]